MSDQVQAGAMQGGIAPQEQPSIAPGPSVEIVNESTMDHDDAPDEDQVEGEMVVAQMRLEAILAAQEADIRKVKADHAAAVHAAKQAVKKAEVGHNANTECPNITPPIPNSAITPPPTVVTQALRPLHATKASYPAPKPYDDASLAKARNADVYLEDVGAWMVHAGVQDAARAIASMTDGQVREWWGGRCARWRKQQGLTPGNPLTIPWDVICQSFKEMVGQTRNAKQKALQALLSKQVLQGDQPVEGYYARFHAHYLHCEEDLSQEVASTLFVQGLRPSLREKCLTNAMGEPFSTLDEAQRFAYSKELQTNAVTSNTRAFGSHSSQGSKRPATPMAGNQAKRPKPNTMGEKPKCKFCLQAGAEVTFSKEHYLTCPNKPKLQGKGGSKTSINGNSHKGSRR